MKQSSYCLLVTSFFILCQAWNYGMFTCVSQSWAASWPGSRRLLDVFSVSDRGLWPLSQTGEENHPFALVRHCVMLLIPVGLQAFIVWWTDRWKRNNYGIRLLTDGGHTHSEKSVHELEFRTSIHTCIFPNARAVEVLPCERSFSAGGRRVVWGLSLMAQFSCWDIKSLPLLLFFCFFFPFSNTETLTQWQLPSTRLSGNQETTKGQCSFWLCGALQLWMQGFRVQRSTLCRVI